MNILITSAGRRVSLVRNFQKYAKVFTCDMNPKFSAACQISDGYFKVSRADTDSYINEVLEFCKKNDVKIVVPTIDTELINLSKNRDKFKKEGIFLAISSLEICETFYLKTSTYNFFKNNGFLTPKIIDNLEKATYPLFAKLDNSSLSIGAMRVENYEEAKKLKAKNSNYVFQEFIEGTEYTVDCFIDKKGKVISIVPRERIRVRCGEVEKARTKKDKKIIAEVKRLCEKLDGAYGTLTIQLFLSGDKIYFIEINPRFGGGYPLTYLAGADFAKFLIDDVNGVELNYFEGWRDNLIMLRYDAEVVVDGNSI